MQYYHPPSFSNFLSPLCIFSLCTLTSASCSWLVFYTSCFLFPRSSRGLFNGMLEVSEPGALNYYTLLHFILLALFVSRNLTLIYFPLSRSKDTLLCDLIAPTPSLAFSLPMPCTLAATSLFLSSKAYPSLNFLPPFFFRLTFTLIMSGSTSY